jgi:hypothetical protein
MLKIPLMYEQQYFIRRNSSILLPVPPALLLDDYDARITRALVDKSGVFPCQYHSTMVLHVHYITCGMNNMPVGS